MGGGISRHGTCHGTARKFTARQGISRHGPENYGTARKTSARHITLRHGTEFHGTARSNKNNKKCFWISKNRITIKIINFSKFGFDISSFNVQNHFLLFLFERAVP